MKQQLLCLVIAGLAATQASAYQVSGPKWTNGTFTIYRGVPEVALSGETWNDAITRAISAWDTPVDGLKINIIPTIGDPCEGYTGETNTTTPPVRDDTALGNGIGVKADMCGSDFGVGVIAVTLLQTNVRNGTFVEADIIFNGNRPFDIYSGPFQGTFYDVERVAARELGLALGLANETFGSTIMHPNAATRSVTGPTADDIAGMNALYPVPAPEPAIKVKVAIEEPGNNQTKSGITNIRGWAVGLEKITAVEYQIDSGAFKRAPYGSQRSDVASAYSAYPVSGNSGYSFAFNWGNLAAGQHSITVRATDLIDRTATATNNFTVTKFDSAFIPGNKVVSINGSSTITNQKTINLNNVNADGKNYNLQLEWDNAAQKFNINNISK